MLTRSQRRRVDKTEEAAQQANIPALANLSDDLLLDCCKLLPDMLNGEWTFHHLQCSDLWNLDLCFVFFTHL